MNLTQNDRLKQVTSDTLIVGVDVGSQTHFCRAFDWRGFELSRRVFKFSNTGMGFLTFLRWTEELMNKTEMKKVIVGCEPTGCYWLTFQKFLQDHDIQLVTVNPFTVNRSMELDDNSPEKSDLKDPKTIALLVKDGRYSTSYLPSGVYAEIREASVCRDQIMKQHVRLSNQIQGWLQKFFPEYLECYADWNSSSGLMQWNPAFQDVVIYKNPDLKSCSLTGFQSYTILCGFYQGLRPLYACRTHLCITPYLIDSTCSDS